MADKVVTVSGYTKNIVVHKHGVPAEKVEVVYNGCDAHEPDRLPPVLSTLKQQGKKIVLYHGRISIQKGVDYFVRAARRVVDVDPNVVFVISGWGDMKAEIIELVGKMGLSKMCFLRALFGKKTEIVCTKVPIWLSCLPFRNRSASFLLKLCNREHPQ